MKPVTILAAVAALAVAGGADAASILKRKAKAPAPAAPAASASAPADPYAEVAAPPAGPASGPFKRGDYAKLEKLPDWGGIWTFNFAPPGPQPVLTPEYAARMKAKQEAQARGLDSVRPSNCLPPGMPIVMTQPYNVEFVFSPGKVTLVQEAYMQVRRIFTDGRGHPEGLEASFNGHSIGHWEGGTLVVDTIGLKPVTFMVGATPHSDKMHIVERIGLKDPDTLVDEMTIDDPEALAQPWKTTVTYTRHREWDQIEFICEENNRNPVDEAGKTKFILRDNQDAH